MSSSEETKADDGGVRVKALVASASVLKVDAVVAALHRVFGTRARVSVLGESVESGVNAQPFGTDETMKGARTRLHGLTFGTFKPLPGYSEGTMVDACLVSENHDDTFFVAIENGVVQVPGFPDRFVDVGWVLVTRGLNGRVAAVPTAGVPFPSWAVQEAKRRGFAGVTVGDVLAERDQTIDPKNPHRGLTGGAADRTDLLVQALAVAISNAATKNDDADDQAARPGDRQSGV